MYKVVIGTITAGRPARIGVVDDPAANLSAEEFFTMKKRVGYPIAALALFASGSVFAQQTLIDDINVTATVTAACSELTATDVDFGSAGAADAIDDSTSTISVTCDNGTAYTVELDYGMSSLGTQRQVTGAGGEFMDYAIFQDAGFTTPWGDIANGEQFDGVGTGAADPLTAYFRLQRNAGSSPGTYTDLVGVTLTF
jgi:spore coat protein U-like protein